MYTDYWIIYWSQMLRPFRFIRVVEWKTLLGSIIYRYIGFMGWGDMVHHACGTLIENVVHKPHHHPHTDTHTSTYTYTHTHTTVVYSLSHVCCFFVCLRTTTPASPVSLSDAREFNWNFSYLYVRRYSQAYERAPHIWWTIPQVVARVPALCLVEMAPLGECYWHHIVPGGSGGKYTLSMHRCVRARLGSFTGSTLYSRTLW